MYRYHPIFPKLLDDKIAELIDENLRVSCMGFSLLKVTEAVFHRLRFQYKLMLSEDGSGIGAAVVAAVAARIKTQKDEDQNEEDENKEQMKEQN